MRVKAVEMGDQERDLGYILEAVCRSLAEELGKLRQGSKGGVEVSGLDVFALEQPSEWWFQLFIFITH